MDLEQYLRQQIEITLKNIKECEKEKLQFGKCYNEGLYAAYNDALQELILNKVR